MQAFPLPLQKRVQIALQLQMGRPKTVPRRPERGWPKTVPLQQVPGQSPRRRWRRDSLKLQEKQNLQDSQTLAVIPTELLEKRQWRG
jgi:hypothetical protein